MSSSRQAFMSFITITVLSAFSFTSHAQAAKKYNATFYVAGMGGHFAKAEIVIDPAKTKEPLSLKSLDKVDIGTRKTHPTHDPRIDAYNNDTMFWSTYRIDQSAELTNVKAAHVGKTNLRIGEVILDMLVDIPFQAIKTGSLYCASAQTKDYFLPISMTNKGYIDVFQKSDLKKVQRIFLENSGHRQTLSLLPWDQLS